MNDKQENILALSVSVIAPALLLMMAWLSGHVHNVYSLMTITGTLMAVLTASFAWVLIVATEGNNQNTMAQVRNEKQNG